MVRYRPLRGRNTQEEGKWSVREDAGLHPQLREVEQELAAATTRAARLVDRVDESGFHRRPGAGRWSIAECLGHLNLTSRAYLPLIDDALQIGRILPVPPPRRFRRDFTGWLLCRMAEPPYRRRATTTGAFIPDIAGTRADILAEFVRLQQELTTRVYHADGLDLTSLIIVSPFDGRLQYHLYSCLRVLPTHQRRHLWQAEQVMAQLPLLGTEARETLRLAGGSAD
jgi:hypothetical protein